MPCGAQKMLSMKSDINKVLVTLLARGGIKLPSSQSSVNLLRRFLTAKGVKFGFSETEDQLTARALSLLGDAVAGSAPPITTAPVVTTPPIDPTAL